MLRLWISIHVLKMYNNCTHSFSRRSSAFDSMHFFIGDWIEWANINWFFFSFEYFFSRSSRLKQYSFGCVKDEKESVQGMITWTRYYSSTVFNEATWNYEKKWGICLAKDELNECSKCWNDEERDRIKISLWNQNWEKTLLMYLHA